MDLQNERHDDLIADEITGALTQLGNVRKSVLIRAKTKKAQKISDAGGYATLTPYQKTLIPVPEYISGKTVPASGDLPAGEQTGVDIKRFLPYIIGVVLLGIIIYMIAKKKK
jgi:LPXTG-motif cell wall-anchored protein